MTQASRSGNNRHDTVADMSARSGRGTARQTIRVDETLWDEFGETAEPDRSTVIREFIRWYVGQAGAKLPKRPRTER